MVWNTAAKASVMRNIPIISLSRVTSSDRWCPSDQLHNRHLKGSFLFNYSPSEGVCMKSSTFNLDALLQRSFKGAAFIRRCLRSLWTKLELKPNCPSSLDFARILIFRFKGTQHIQLTQFADDPLIFIQN